MGNCIDDGQGIAVFKIAKGALSMVPVGDIAGQALTGIEGAANVIEAAEGAGNVVGMVGNAVGGEAGEIINVVGEVGMNVA